MRKADRPTLALHVAAGLESAQIQIDENFWQILTQLQVPTTYAQVVEERSNRFSRATGLPAPPHPKRSAILQMTLVDYARSLFIAEGNLYEHGPQLRRWLTELKHQVIRRVMKAVAEMEEASKKQRLSFEHHGVTPAAMRAVMADSLNALIDDRLAPWQPLGPLPPPPEVQLQMRAAIDAHPGIKTDETEVERRAALLSAYRSATGAKDYHIYTARNSGIHKPEFYQWRDGRLPAKSKVTKRFESFLKAKRRPIPRKPTS